MYYSLYHFLNLYIPIWWYSNIQTSFLYRRYFNYFTFQYGDIQIDTGYLKNNAPKIFTFQYGDIQICYKAISRKWLKIPLHSNMVIFKYVRRIPSRTHFSSLHSNMVIFKWTDRYLYLMLQSALHSNMVIFKFNDKTAENLLLDAFTFQYGDIQIQQRGQKALCFKLNFTFQYGDIQIVSK